MNRTPSLCRLRSGFTLLEMVVVLALLGLGIPPLLHVARRQNDRMAALAAREAVAGLVHRARQEALALGGSEVVLRVEPPEAALVARGDTLARARIQEIFGVELGLSRSRLESVLKYGPLGLGQVSSQTLTFRRGTTEILLVVSALGRVSRP